MDACCPTVPAPSHIPAQPTYVYGTFQCCPGGGLPIDPVFMMERTQNENNVNMTPSDLTPAQLAPSLGRSTCFRISRGFPPTLTEVEDMADLLLRDRGGGRIGTR